MGFFPLREETREEARPRGGGIVDEGRVTEAVVESAVEEMPFVKAYKAVKQEYLEMGGVKYDPATLNEKYPGLPNPFAEPMNLEAADYVAENQIHEQNMLNIASMGERGVVSKIGRFAINMGLQTVDPINLLTFSGIRKVLEAKVAIQGAIGAGIRTGAEAGSASAVSEGISYIRDTQEGKDFDSAQAFKNIIEFSAGFGVLGLGVGALSSRIKGEALNVAAAQAENGKPVVVDPVIEARKYEALTPADMSAKPSAELSAITGERSTIGEALTGLDAETAERARQQLNKEGLRTHLDDAAIEKASEQLKVATVETMESPAPQTQPVIDDVNNYVDDFGAEIEAKIVEREAHLANQEKLGQKVPKAALDAAKAEKNIFRRAAELAVDCLRGHA